MDFSAEKSDPLRTTSPRKQAHHKRPSLSNIFGNLNISSPASGHTSKMISGMNLARSLREKFQLSREPGGTVRVKASQVEATFTIKMDDIYDYNLLGDDADPDELHIEMAKYGAKISEILSSLPSEKDAEDADEFILDALARMVFGSNAIENTGSGLDVTLKLCLEIFKGSSVGDQIEERTPEYEALKADLLKRGLPADTTYIVRSRREIVQHALAAKYIISEVFLNDKDLSEEIIKNTHKILTTGVNTEDGTAWTEYSGKYREVSVGAGLHVFTPPKQVPREMRVMISRLNKDLALAVQTGCIDPVALATKYCHIFVNIHPFEDGNGRVCRLILNTILLKYGSFLVCMGQEDDTREEYLHIASKASLSEASSTDMFDDDEEDQAPKHYKELASFTLKHAHTGVKKFINSLRGKGAVSED